MFKGLLAILLKNFSWLQFIYCVATVLLSVAAFASRMLSHTTIVDNLTITGIQQIFGNR